MNVEPRPARRVLVTGLSTYWGGRLAQALESFPEIEAIIGVDTREPTRELERTEYVKVGNQHSLIQRIVIAAEIDTVIDTRLVVDAIATSRSDAHENNVIGTLNILAACAGPDSPVRKLIFKSSAHWYGCEQDDPAFFTEEMGRQHPPHTAIERDVVEAEAAVADFADKHRDVTVTILRCANVLGPDVDTSHTRMFSLPMVPMILGFDPRYQFAHEDDVVHALEHCAFNDLEGTYNVARQALPADPAASGHGAGGRTVAAAGSPGAGRDAQPAALRPRPRQSQAEGDRLSLPVHVARGRSEPGGEHAPAPGAGGGERALSLRARGGGVPALESQCAPR
jgi:UDP-glucose 4-epimerase